ncbi:hypothetical protein D3C79_749410 [compost metagenome]
MPAAVGVAAHKDGAIGLLVPDKVGHLKGAASVVEQLITGAGAGEVGDRPVGVVAALGQQKGQPGLVSQPGQQAAQGGVLLADRQPGAQGTGQLAAQQLAGALGGGLHVVHVAGEPAAQIAVIAGVQGEGLPLASGALNGEGGAAAGVEIQHQIVVDQAQRLAGESQYSVQFHASMSSIGLST